MVMASWPAARKRGEAVRLPESVHRRVAEATRLATRQALRVAVPLVAVGMGADAIHLVVRFGERGLAPAALDALAIAISLALGLAATRFLRHPQLPALATLTTLYAVTLLNMGLVPAITPVANAYLATIVIGSALFVPWSPRWHTLWLAVAIALTSASVAVAFSLNADSDLAASQLMATAIAVLASTIGHGISYARTQRMLEQQFELRRLSRLATAQEREVAALNGELLRSARVDTVTGIGNRRALDEALASLVGQRLAAVLLDVDHFKAFNDRNGHLAGDAALSRVGEILRESVRQRDLVFRYGGEEFLILLPGSDRDGAANLAERVRRAVEEDRAVAHWGLTVSAGVAVADRFSASSPLPLLRRADAALYQAKRTGRNRVVVDDAFGVPLPAVAG